MQAHVVPKKLGGLPLAVIATVGVTKAASSLHHKQATMSSIVHSTLCSLCMIALAAASTVTIAPGVHQPLVNLGGISIKPSNYSSWLAVGGRGLDTALNYGDAVQKEVAAAMQSSIVPRDQIFLTTKIPCCPPTMVGSGFGSRIRQSCAIPEFGGSAAGSIARDMKLLGKSDLLLLHWPCDTLADTLAAYAQLEDALEQGLTRAIGVSNFNVSMLKKMLPAIKVKPAVNQCGHSIGAHNSSKYRQLEFPGGDDETVQFCQRHGISYSAYSPLGGLEGTDVFKDPTVIAIGKKHDVGPAQVALRWLVQQNISVVTSGVNPVHQAEDLDLFSFNLTGQEMQQLGML